MHGINKKAKTSVLKSTGKKHFMFLYKPMNTVKFSFLGDMFSAIFEGKVNNFFNENQFNKFNIRHPTTVLNKDNFVFNDLESEKKKK